MKSLKKFSKTIIKNLADQLIHFHQQQDSEVLHEIRVNIKRIKAVLNATQFDQKKFKAHKAYLPYRKIFRKAGAIREPEVLKEILSETTASKTTSALTAETAKPFVNEVPGFLVAILQQWKKDEPFISKVQNKVLHNYVHYLMKRVQKALSGKLEVENLHYTRKAIKEILYLSKVTKSLSKKDRTYYTELEDLIGKWHDKQILLNDKTKLKETSPSDLDRLKSMSEKDKQTIKQLVTRYYKG